MNLPLFLFQSGVNYNAEDVQTSPPDRMQLDVLQLGNVVETTAPWEKYLKQAALRIEEKVT